MRNKLKKIRNLLAITLLIAFISCEKENFSEESTTSKKGITVKEIKLGELFKDKRFKDLYNKLSPSSEFSKTSLEIENGFTIPDGNVKVIETDSVISYTMYIERDNQILLDKFENLVIQESKIDGLKLAYVLKYTPEEIKLMADNSFLFKGVIQKSNIISPLFNNVYSTSDGDCFVYVLMCDFEGEHVAGTHCTVSHLYLKAVKVLCPTDEAPSTPNSGSDGSSTSGSDGTGTTSGGGSDGTGGSPNDDGGVLTTPVLGDFHFDGPKNDKEKTPCDDLASISNPNEGNILPEINWLKTKVDEAKEYGVEVERKLNYDGETYNYPMNEVTSNQQYRVPLATGDFVIGSAHSHPINSYAIPSFGDIKWLLDCYSAAANTRKPYAFSMVVCKDFNGVINVYALKINNISALTAKVAAVWNNPKYAGITNEDEKLDAIHNAQALKMEQSGNQLEKSFLQQFGDFGIDIFKASDDNLSNWNKLELSNTLPLTVTPTPCNN